MSDSTIIFDTDDFDNLVSALTKLPEWRTETDRWTLFEEVVADSPRRADLMGMFNSSGNPRGVAVRTIQWLNMFGEDKPGRRVLAVLVNRMIQHLGGQDARELTEIMNREKYRFHLPPVALRDLGANEWRGKDTLVWYQEHIFEKDPFRDIGFLERALSASQAIVRIEVPGTRLGTGFMIAPNLLMTNYHVIRSEEDAQRAVFKFNYQLGQQSNSMPDQIVRVPEGKFQLHMAPELDMTIVEIVPPTAPRIDYTPLKLTRKRTAQDTRVSIIHHPGGDYKKISLHNNFVAFANSDTVQYTTSTHKGSSGSPVFNDDFEVVALHHSGGELAHPETKIRYKCNAGTSMIAILNHLEQNAKTIFSACDLG